VVALLDEAAERPLTALCRPAGYGKTTPVAAWLDTVEAPAAWRCRERLTRRGGRSTAASIC
jgi:ATP/maltotriose-dependent transcriptional regulator MalT